MGEVSSAVDEEGRDRRVRRGRELDFSSSSRRPARTVRLLVSRLFRLALRPPAIAEILKPRLLLLLLLPPPPGCFSPPIVLCVGMKTLLYRICNFWISF